MTAAGRCTSMTPTSSTARSARGSGARASSFIALDGKSYEVDGDMCVIADDRARARAWRGDRRRGDRRHRRHHQRLHRVGLFRSEAHGAHRPQARHSVRRAVPVRARRRSRLRGAGARACHRAWCSNFAAARPSKITIAGKPPKAEQAVQIRSRPGQAPERARARAAATSSACSPRSASRSTARASSSRPRRRRGGLTSPARPTWSRRWCGSSASIRCRRRR